MPCTFLEFDLFLVQSLTLPSATFKSRLKSFVMWILWWLLEYPRWHKKQEAYHLESLSPEEFEITLC